MNGKTQFSPMDLDGFCWRKSNVNNMRNVSGKKLEKINELNRIFV